MQVISYFLRDKVLYFGCIFMLSNLSFAQDGINLITNKFNDLLSTDPSVRKNYSKNLEIILGMLKDEDAKNELDSEFIIEVLRMVPASPTILNILNTHFDKEKLQSIYTPCVVKSVKNLNRDQKDTIATYLAMLGDDCKYKAPLDELRSKPTDINDLAFQINVALSFTKSYPKETESLAIEWFNYYLNYPENSDSKKIHSEGGRVTEFLAEDMNKLLAACGTRQCLEDILHNLDISGGGAEQISALNYLAAAHYKPVFSVAEKFIFDSDCDFTVKLAALSAMQATVDNSTEARFQAAINSLQANKEFMTDYVDQMNKIIKK